MLSNTLFTLIFLAACFIVPYIGVRTYYSIKSNWGKPANIERMMKIAFFLSIIGALYGFAVGIGFYQNWGSAALVIAVGTFSQGFFLALNALLLWKRSHFAVYHYFLLLIVWAAIPILRGNGLQLVDFLGLIFYIWLGQALYRAWRRGYFSQESELMLEAPFD